LKTHGLVRLDVKIVANKMWMCIPIEIRGKYAYLFRHLKNLFDNSQASFIFDLNNKQDERG
jgi:hypothetical protein